MRCSKLIIETLEQLCSSVSIVNFEQVNAGWDLVLLFLNGKVIYPANTYLFKVNNGNTKKRDEICSKLTKKEKTSERRH